MAQELDIGNSSIGNLGPISTDEKAAAAIQEEIRSGGRRKKEKIIYQDDDSLDQWCAIRVIEYNYRAEQVKNQETVVCDIMLPMPLQLQTGYNQQWTELDDMSAIMGHH